MRLSKSAILSAVPSLVGLPVPELGGVVYLRPLTVAGLMKFLAEKETLASAELYPLMLILSVCDEAGAPIFDREDLEALKSLDFSVVKFIGEAALKLNKLGKEDDEAQAKN